jgi:hypothetical protein
VFDLTFTVDAQDTTTPLTLPIDRAVIAGWTGRDPVARDKHIAELEAIGIARPASTPIYYRVAACRLTTEDSIEVSGTESSGEVEFVLIGWQGRTFVGVGSDHTDRKVEAYSVTVSKQTACCRLRNSSHAVLKARACRTAAPCSAAPLRPRAASGRRPDSNSSSRTPC